jgi:oligoribonuclease
VPDAKADIRENWLLWCDLETSGSDVKKDCIIEVGMILTNCDLEEISSFQSLVYPTEQGWGRMMQNDIVRTMHQNNGLMDELIKVGKEAPRVDEVARGILKWLVSTHAPQGKIGLAGSGVGHFDRAFIQKFMPQVMNYLRYWVLDVGVIRRSYEMFTGLTPGDQNGDNKAHRAMDDIRHHLEEARTFRQLWRSYECLDFDE